MSPAGPRSSVGVEQETSKLKVAGSSPAGGTIAYMSETRNKSKNIRYSTKVSSPSMGVVTRAVVFIIFMVIIWLAVVAAFFFVLIRILPSPA